MLAHAHTTAPVSADCCTAVTHPALRHAVDAMMCSPFAADLLLCCPRLPPQLPLQPHSASGALTGAASPVRGLATSRCMPRHQLISVLDAPPFPFAALPCAHSHAAAARSSARTRSRAVVDMAAPAAATAPAAALPKSSAEAVTAGTTFVWTLEGLDVAAFTSAPINRRWYSPEFTAAGRRWALLLVPNGLFVGGAEPAVGLFWSSGGRTAQCS
jgi:hypothetical protein